MNEVCTHLDQVADIAPSSEGCEDCLRIGGEWVHLRVCMSCGHVGCCDSSPNRHATAHVTAEHHPIVQSIQIPRPWSLLRSHDHFQLEAGAICIESYEPGEDWWYCYTDAVGFEVGGAPSFTHP